MKITIIRHGKVKMKWPNKCNSKIFDKACKDYDNADIEMINCPGNRVEGKNIYVSNLRRSHETADVLFKSNDILELIGIQEVPLRSFADLDITLPVWVWNVMGRLQWYLNMNRQPECRNATIKRADLVIAELEKQGTDCILVTHGFFMKTLVNRLKKFGFHICGGQMLAFNNLQSITAEKP